MTMTAMSRLGAVTPATGAIALEVLEALKAATGKDLDVVWGKSAAGEHATGRALDFMLYIGPGGSIDAAAGDWIADYLWTHRARLGLIYEIWSKRIRSTVVSPGVWRVQGDRGNPTENHYDHVHAMFAGTDTPPAAPPAPPTQIEDLTMADIAALQAQLSALSRESQAQTDALATLIERQTKALGDAAQAQANALAAAIAALSSPKGKP